MSYARKNYRFCLIIVFFEINDKILSNGIEIGSEGVNHCDNLEIPYSNFIEFEVIGTDTVIDHMNKHKFETTTIHLKELNKELVKEFTNRFNEKIQKSFVK